MSSNLPYEDDIPAVRSAERRGLDFERAVQRGKREALLVELRSLLVPLANADGDELTEVIAPMLRSMAIEAARLGEEMASTEAELARLRQ